MSLPIYPLDISGRHPPRGRCSACGVAPAVTQDEHGPLCAPCASVNDQPSVARAAEPEPDTHDQCGKLRRCCCCGKAQITYMPVCSTCGNRYRILTGKHPKITTDLEHIKAIVATYKDGRKMPGQKRRAVHNRKRPA